MKQWKHRLACLLSVLALLVSGVAQAAEAELPVLSVSGEGSALGSPDQAVVTISVTNHSPDAKTAQQENAARAAAVQNAIRALGIGGKEIQTCNYSFYPTYSREKGRENEINGYQAGNSIVVTVNNLELVGQVIDASLDSGANQISSLDFRLRNTENLRKEALNEAIRDARSKAGIIAQGLGKRIVGIRNVSESTGSAGHRSYNMAMLAKSADSTPIEAGTLALNATVHIEFLLSP